MLRLASILSAPKKNALFALLGAGLLGATLTGCDPIDLDQRTPGNEGTLVFSYGGEAFLDCLFGCAIDRPLMTHTSVTIVVDDADPSAVLTARTSSTKAAVDSFEAHVTCQSEDAEGTHDREVTIDEKCAANEERQSFWIAHVSATAPGSFDLEILDDGDVLDSLTLGAKDATRADLHLGSSTDPITALQISMGETQVVTASFFDESGQELASGVTGADWTFGDESVAKFGSPFAILFGPYNALVVEATGPGATSVSLHVGDLEVTLPIQVD